MVIAIKLGEEKLKLNLNFCKNETNTITEQEKECIKNYIEKDNQELYENKFGEYDITHVLIRKNSKLNMFISRNDKYIELYGDNNFVFYQRNED